MIQIKIYGYSDDVVHLETEFKADHLPPDASASASASTIRKSIEFNYNPRAKLVFSNGIEVMLAYGADIPRVFAKEAKDTDNDRYKAGDNWVVKMTNYGRDSLGHGYKQAREDQGGTEVLELIIDSDHVTVAYSEVYEIGKAP